MFHLRTLGVACLSLLAASLNAEDLSQYRGLVLGSNLPAAAMVAGMPVSSARVIHQRPALIQELEWQPRKSHAANYATEPVKEVILTFYDGELSRIAAKYDRFKTEGMTSDDLIAAISQIYGQASKPETEKLTIGSPAYPETVDVLALWSDPQYSCNLVHSTSTPEFTMILFSKRLDALATKASIESARIDEQEAPERDAALRKAREQEEQLVLDKARLANKQAFRP
jgi:hypothetical protein